MLFELNHSLKMLERTPIILYSLLEDLPEQWIRSNEGPETFSPFDVVGHLLHGEKTDWLTRINIILSTDVNKRFEPYDRFAQFAESKGKSIQQLLNEFSEYRKLNVQALKNKNISSVELKLTGIHPKFGVVTLKQLLATWTIHDLAHIAQICRVMSKQYKEEVGPWKEYLNILNR